MSTSDVTVAKEHRIQVRVEDGEWQRALRAAQANGLPNVSALCRFLLQREYERWNLLADAKKPVRRPAKKKARRRAKRQRAK